VGEVDLNEQRVIFQKTLRIYKVQRTGESVAWDSDLIKALRYHMGLNQAEFADQLGVRQQTISEWETGIYAPSRATRKYLTLVAERAGFVYTAEDEAARRDIPPETT
jgi:DNA-binding transcriptional regulator YiaG